MIYILTKKNFLYVDTKTLNFKNFFTSILFIEKSPFLIPVMTFFNSFVFFLHFCFIFLYIFFYFSLLLLFIIHTTFLLSDYKITLYLSILHNCVRTKYCFELYLNYYTPTLEHTLKSKTFIEKYKRKVLKWVNFIGFVLFFNVDCVLNTFSHFVSFFCYVPITSSISIINSFVFSIFVYFYWIFLFIYYLF